MAAAAKVKLSLERQADGHVVIVVGRTEYPLAIPLVAKDGRWRADAAAGRQELLARLIGEHELEAVGVCLAYADAQVAYASKDRNGDGVKEYAQRLVSTPGSYDGLYWDSTADEEPSPAGPGLTPLREALTTAAAPAAPFNGYFWRILTSQGSHAPGGAYSYVINGRMIAGLPRHPAAPPPGSFVRASRGSAASGRVRPPGPACRTCRKRRSRSAPPFAGRDRSREPRGPGHSSRATGVAPHRRFAPGWGSDEWGADATCN